ncbi:ferrous-iron efflux pump FieF [Halalkalicoccus paucihalophilus]|uniref:Ferrous-iron efflux pump FieF n=1 Tax=Halalkalicoccus paucihalophilus TaxID=1008153 RepID=A0A151AH06_9EURY|nr:cation diffusion facilitator family transporter [Halalkalicoccus paucihalophilus]KYH26956.1 ferrous-iron efflux pump FieF [Halalkalicoccus paucihalophilus]
MAGESVGVVLAALVANGAIAALKFGGFLLTGSPAMLAETYHSVSDTGNQVFLLIGIYYGRQDRDRSHPFGYGKAEFFYSFLVSVLLFGIAGWESAKGGYEALVHGEVHLTEGTVTLLGTTVPGIYVNYAVLLGAIVFETYALIKARAAMRAEIDERGWSGYREAFKKTSRTTVLTALTEDTVALAGLGIALAGIYLTRVTGNPVYDGTAALLIGLILMGFALALAWENKRLLIGESLPKTDERELREIVAGWDGVTEITGFRSVHFGPDYLLVAADVGFDTALDGDEIDERIGGIERTLREANESIKSVYIEPQTA